MPEEIMGVPVPGGDEVLFVGLGGLGEIGMNMTMYGHAGSWLIVDLGVTFGDDTTPGIDVMMPDTAFAEAVCDRIAGLVLTHAHEDHVGAVSYLWERLGCPVYATPFTAEFLRQKLAEEQVAADVPLEVVPLGSRFDIGPFDVELVTMTHSIPEPSLLVVHTKCGQVVHSGDWKLDPDPRVGQAVDSAALERIGSDGVLALVCDSTNADVEGWTGSEGALLSSLTELIAARPGRRVAFACFASNIARLETIAEAAAANERQVAVVGRSLRRMDRVARATGYLAGVAEFVGEEHVGFLPRSRSVLICTGSQGEPRAALARIAARSHPHVVLDPGDTLVFSSRDIPGNERAIGRLKNAFLAAGVEIVTADDAFVHVSGHPARDELRALYGWLRPDLVVPMHGEYHHLHANARLARECGVPSTEVAMNGTVLRLTRAGAEPIATVPTGRLALDGRRIVPLDGQVVRGRRRMLHQGAVMVSLVLDRRGRPVGRPAISFEGLFETEEPRTERQVREVVIEALDLLRPEQRMDERAVEGRVSAAVRRLLRAAIGKRPGVTVHVIRLDG